MKRIAIYTTAAAVAMAGSAVLGMGAQANTGATEHCNSTDFPNKVEVDAGTTVQTNLRPGTTVCIKAGTKIMTTVVAADGTITQDQIENKPKTAFLGISYYAYGGHQGCDSTGPCTP